MEGRDTTQTKEHVSCASAARYSYLERPEVDDGRKVEAVVPKESHEVRRPQHRFSSVREGPISYEVYAGKYGQVVLPRTLVCKRKTTTKRERGATNVGYVWAGRGGGYALTFVLDKSSSFLQVQRCHARHVDLGDKITAEAMPDCYRARTPQPSAVSPTTLLT